MRLKYTVEIEVAENEENFQQIEKKIKNNFMGGAVELTKELLSRIEQKWLQEHRGYQRKDKKEAYFKTSYGEFSMERQKVKYREKYFYIIDKWMNLVPYNRSTRSFEEIEKDQLTECSFRKGNKEIEKITGVKSGIMSTWRRFQKMAVNEKVVDKMPVLLKDTPLKRLKPGKDNPCPILCIEPDGTYCKNRRKAEKSHEVKVAVLYTEKKYRGKKSKKAQLINKTLVSSKQGESVESFFGRVAWIAAEKYGVNENTLIIIRGDGDQWIKNLKYDYFPRAKYFLDWWHVKKNMRNTFGKEPTKIMMEYVYNRNPNGLLQHIRETHLNDIHSLGEKTYEVFRSFYYYIENNREGLEFSGIDPEFKKQHPGMFKRGSGAIERNIDLVVGERCKLKRMSWSKQGLDNMIYLRSKKLNKLCA